MKRGKKAKDFVQIGKIRDDHQDMQAFLDENLRYPEKARKNLTHGTVYIAYSVNDDGVVANARVVRGIGDGCDEEALRLVRMLKFQRVKNRKVKVLANREIGIRFQIDKQSAPANKPAQPTSNQTVQQAQTSSPIPTTGGMTLQYSYVPQSPSAQAADTPANNRSSDRANAAGKTQDTGANTVSYTLNLAPDLSGEIVNDSDKDKQ